ncbi:MAG: hypothetical protein ACLPR9_03150 [Acidimicrobiales bacterium]|jgi:hypothetical protein
MTPAVVPMRKNLCLLVDYGQLVPGPDATDTTQWGGTLGNGVYVWRSGLGVTPTAPSPMWVDPGSTTPTWPIPWHAPVQCV